MTIGLLILLIYFFGAVPGIIVGYLYDRKGVPQKATAVFSRPDGSRVQAQVDVTWSWTIFVFRGWSLAFRGQFMEWIITFIITLFLGSIGPFNVLMVGISGTSNHLSELNLTTDFIVVYTLAFTGYMIWINYLVIYGNKRRILTQMKRGMDFSTTPDYPKLLEYLGVTQRTPQSDLAPNVKAGQSHDYVVPDAVVKEEKEAQDDYSMLTVNDLKLLLKSEGVPYSTYDDKEALLKLVDEHIKVEEKADTKESEDK